MRRFSALLLIATLALGALAQEFKGVTYKRPAGWDEAVEGDAKIFTPKGLKEGEILAIIMTGAVPSNGSSWEKQFTDTVALANEGGKASDVENVEKRELSGVTLILQAMRLDQKEIGKHSRLYAQVSHGQQRVFVTVISNADALLEKHGDALMEFIGNLGFKSSTGETAKPNPGPNLPAASKIPIGNTPNTYPGTPGWLPSGQGVSIPAPAIVGGKPVGMWNTWTYVVGSGTRADVRIYLADGTRATNPRLGGGAVYDVNGQRAQKGATGVGSFAISNGQIVEKYDGFENRSPYSSGKDDLGQFFKIGGATFRPMTPPAIKSMVGHWKGQGVDYKFKADGTFEMGATHANGDWAVVGFDTGTYVVDGYLIMLSPSKGAQFVSVVGLSGKSLIIGNMMYEKK